VVTTPDIQQQIQQLEAKWNDPSAKKGLFGNILKTVNIKNIRAINTEIELAWFSEPTNDEAAKAVVENIKSCLEAD
jgi:hypothetical protein